MERNRVDHWTRSGVRLRRDSQREGKWNWLFVPGGPGLGSESVTGLARAAELPGTVWLIDLPGDGSNRGVSQVSQRPYTLWPGVLAEVADELDEIVMVGHSTGAMFMLSVPELADRLVGMALVSSAPHAGWRRTFGSWAEAHPLPGLKDAAQAYAMEPNDRTLRDLTLAAAAWNFTAAGLAEGHDLLEHLPYCQDAVAWAEANFDDDYLAKWKPRGSKPATLIVSGAEDHVVDQRLWQHDPAFNQPHTLKRTIENAGHFPWIENPHAVRTAFEDFVDLLERAH